MELNKEQEDVLQEILDKEVKKHKEIKENKTINDGKAIEWYSILVNANVTTRFEKDRQLLTLASLAIGVLASFMRDITNSYSFGFWLFSGICFLVTIILSLNIFQQNQDLLEDIINAKNTDRLDAILKKKDDWMFWIFIFGVFSLFILALLQFKFNNCF